MGKIQLHIKQTVTALSTNEQLKHCNPLIITSVINFTVNYSLLQLGCRHHPHMQYVE